MSEKSLMIILPTYTGSIHCHTTNCLIHDMLGLAARGHHFRVVHDIGNADIRASRNWLITQFLNSDCTDLFFVDWDVIWPTDTMSKFLEAPVDLVAGVYRQRIDPEQYALRWLPDRPTLQADPATGFLEVEAVPAGFMRVSRAGVERIVAKFPDSQGNSPNGKVWRFFNSIIGPDNMEWGEDFSFCWRFAQAGGQIWIDPDLELGHVGYKTFSGSLGKWLRNKPTFLDDVRASFSDVTIEEAA